MSDETLTDLTGCINIVMQTFTFRVECRCGSCGKRKQKVSEWERHTGSRAKKWKTSVKVKSSKLPLEQWVCF